MLTLDNLRWRYARYHYCFSTRISAGERVAVLGRSGAGKSTLLHLIAGFLHAEAGKIWLNGEDHTFTAPAQRPLSILFQENNLFSHLTVEQNLALGLHPGLKLTAAQRTAITATLEQIGLSGLAQRLPGQLSGGQRQRVALARCLLRDKPLLLLDEPFSALDPGLRQEMLQWVLTLCQQRGITLLIVSHHLEEVQTLATRALVVDEGRFSFDGALRDLPAQTFQPVNPASS